MFSEDSLFSCYKRLTIEQISNFVHVDFKVGYFDVEFEIFLHPINVIENIIDNSRYDS